MTFGNTLQPTAWKPRPRAVSAAARLRNRLRAGREAACRARRPSWSPQSWNDRSHAPQPDLTSSNKGRSQALVIPTRERSETGGICCPLCETNSQRKGLVPRSLPFLQPAGSPTSANSPKPHDTSQTSIASSESPETTSTTSPAETLSPETHTRRSPEPHKPPTHQSRPRDTP